MFVPGSAGGRYVATWRVKGLTVGLGLAYCPAPSEPPRDSRGGSPRVHRKGFEFPCVGVVTPESLAGARAVRNTS